MKTIVTVLQILVIGSALVTCLLLWISVELDEPRLVVFVSMSAGVLVGFAASVIVVRLFGKESTAGRETQS